MAAVESASVFAVGVWLAILSRDEWRRLRARVLAQNVEAEVILGRAKSIDGATPKFSDIGAKVVVYLSFTYDVRPARVYVLGDPIGIGSDGVRGLYAGSMLGLRMAAAP